MNVLLLNLTGNRNGWEDQNVEQMGSRLEALGNHVTHLAAHDSDQVMDAAQCLGDREFDFTIVVAHGEATQPVSYLGLSSEAYGEVLNNPYLLPSVFPSIWRNHKLLIVCEGLNSDTIAAVAVGLPDNPVSEESIMIAKATAVEADEAVHLVDGIFGELGPGSSPSKALVLSALHNVRESTAWWGVEGTNAVMQIAEEP